MQLKGIYMIKNIFNDKVYIGQAIDIEKRWLRHENLLINKKHHNKTLQSDFNLYGFKAFTFTAIEKKQCKRMTIKDKENLNKREQYYIKKYRKYFIMYN